MASVAVVEVVASVAAVVEVVVVAASVAAGEAVVSLVAQRSAAPGRPSGHRLPVERAGARQHCLAGLQVASVDREEALAATDRASAIALASTTDRI